jgi:sugar lactone lactonase YvrE
MKTKILLKTFLSLGAIFGLVAVAQAQNLYVTVNGPLGPGNNGSISEYTPVGARTTFASGIPLPRGLAFDSYGNLFAAITAIVDDHLLGKVVTFNPRRRATPIGAAPFYGVFEGVAIDAAGNVYVLTAGGEYPSTIFKFVPGVSRSVFGTLPGGGFDIAFDGAGNLYAADAGEATIYKFAPNGTRTVFAGPDAFAEDTFPVGLAFDSSGNLFVSTEGNPGNDSILMFAPNGAESTFASGLTQPRGLAFDGAGNLFVAETRPAPLGDILKFAPGGGSPTVFATGIARPEFLTFGPPQ